ncbi:MAG: sialate O-acetylesterase [Verrucomicrobiota bacterium]
MKHTFHSSFAGLIAIGLLAAGAQPNAMAEVRLPAIFSDHMVLQQDSAVPVWGWAEPGEEITVSIAGQTKTTKANAAGKWSLKLDKLKAGDTLTLTVTGKNTLTVQDVLVGEVWLCSGQSNMGMTVSSSKDFEQEKAAANYPQLRMFKEGDGASPTPQEEGKGAWLICTPENVGGFSASAYFFGREIHKVLNQPVGLINSSVGGTTIEAWTSWEAQKDIADLKPVFERWDKMQAGWDPAKATAQYEQQMAQFKANSAKAKAAGKAAPRAPRKPSEPRLESNHPANLFNGKIMPLLPYSIHGAIWYQGESNAGNGSQYALQLATMIKDWRARWGYDFPFIWVQLPDFRKAQTAPVEDTGWVRVRDGMLKTLSLPNTGMAVTLGLGEPDNIHPKNKQEVGRRLAQWALAKVYQQKGIVASGPLPSGHEIRGNEIIVSFNYTDGGLAAKAGALKGFAIAGEDKKWVTATARIDGDKIIVSSPEVPKPAAVRYAWAENPEFNLYNGAGLPATPFRTDDWPQAVPEAKK